MEYICDYCGATVQSGIANIADHQFTCPKVEVVNYGWFSAIYRPFLSLTQITPAIANTATNYGTKESQL